MPDAIYNVMHTMIGPLTLADWASWFCILTGSFFTLVGVLGIVRLPDIFSRMHGAGIVDTLGIMMILAGLMFQAEEWIVVVKLFLVLLFIFFTSPTTTFALARAAIYGGVNPGHTVEDRQDEIIDAAMDSLMPPPKYIPKELTSGREKAPATTTDEEPDTSNT